MIGETKVARAAVQTLSYLHLFQYAPTSTEVWQLLWNTSAELTEVEAELRDPATDRFSVSGAFVSLIGNESLQAVRLARYRIAELKLERARRAARWIGLLPWVEGIAACNSLGYQNTKKESDIDFFIIVKPDALWLTRFIVVGIAKLMGVRPTATHAADTLCFSFWITTRQLNLSKVALPGEDPYLAFWTVQLTPLFGRDGIWSRFWLANSWVQALLPNVAGYTTLPHALYQTASLTGSVGRLVKWLNNRLGTWQRRRLPVSLRTVVPDDSHGVVIDDDTLKFHTHDRRAQYRDEWRRQRQALGVD